jgi:hypothetical protein
MICSTAQAGVSLKATLPEQPAGRPAAATQAPSQREVRPAPADGSMHYAPNGMPLPAHLHSPQRRCVPRAPYYLNGVLIVNDFYCNG